MAIKSLFFEFSNNTNEDITIVDEAGKNVTLHRLVAIQDIPEFNIKKGTLCGFAERLEQVQGSALVLHGAKVYGNAEVYDSSSFPGDCVIDERATICGNAVVNVSKVSGRNVRISGNAVLTTSKVSGDVKIGGEAHIKKSTITGEDIVVDGNASILRSTISGKNIVIGKSFPNDFRERERRGWLEVSPANRSEVDRSVITDSEITGESMIVVGNVCIDNSKLQDYVYVGGPSWEGTAEPTPKNTIMITKSTLVGAKMFNSRIEAAQNEGLEITNSYLFGSSAFNLTTIKDSTLALSTCTRLSKVVSSTCQNTYFKWEASAENKDISPNQVTLVAEKYMDKE